MPKTVKTVDVTPIFNYTRNVEIVKRFTEQLTKLSAELDQHDAGVRLADYVKTNIDHVRGAISETMADDIQLQIHKGTFPLRRAVILSGGFHPFTPTDHPAAGDICSACGRMDATSAEHTL